MSNTEAIFRNVHEHTVGNLRFTLMQDGRSEQWVTEAYLRVDGGIRHQVMRWYKRPRVSEIIAECRNTTFVSPRPYVLGQACDGSIGYAVIALYADFCRARNLDPQCLMHRAYSDEGRSDPKTYTVARQYADWETTTFPKPWDAPAVNGLIESLHEINYHQLATQVELFRQRGVRAA